MFEKNENVFIFFFTKTIETTFETQIWLKFLNSILFDIKNVFILSKSTTKKSETIKINFNSIEISKDFEAKKTDRYFMTYLFLWKPT